MQVIRYWSFPVLDFFWFVRAVILHTNSCSSLLRFLHHLKPHATNFSTRMVTLLDRVTLVALWPHSSAFLFSTKTTVGTLFDLCRDLADQKRGFWSNWNVFSHFPIISNISNRMQTIILYLGVVDCFTFPSNYDLMLYIIDLLI